MNDVPLILTQSIDHKCKVIRLCYVTFTRANGRGREAPETGGRFNTFMVGSGTAICCNYQSC